MEDPHEKVVHKARVFHLNYSSVAPSPYKVAYAKGVYPRSVWCKSGEPPEVDSKRIEQLAKIRFDPLAKSSSRHLDETKGKIDAGCFKGSNVGLNVCKSTGKLPNSVSDKIFKVRFFMSKL